MKLQAYLNKIRFLLEGEEALGRGEEESSKTKPFMQTISWSLYTWKSCKMNIYARLSVELKVHLKWTVCLGFLGPCARNCCHHTKYWLFFLFNVSKLILGKLFLEKVFNFYILWKKNKIIIVQKFPWFKERAWLWFNYQLCCENIKVN